MQEISAMTDRELLEEIASNIRAVTELVAGVMESPMIVGMQNGASPFQLMQLMRG
jgi:hypothetical protein